MVSNALTTSMSPKFTLFRDMGVRGWGGPPKVLSPLHTPHTTSTPSCTYCVGGGYFLPQSKEERKEIGSEARERGLWNDPRSQLRT